MENLTSHVRALYSVPAGGAPFLRLLAENGAFAEEVWERVHLHSAGVVKVLPSETIGWRDIWAAAASGQLAYPFAALTSDVDEQCAHSHSIDGCPSRFAHDEPVHEGAIISADELDQRLG